MSRCKQCHLDGHHKMSCTDESNATRKDRVTVPATLKEPIVEGQYWLLACGDVHRIRSQSEGWRYGSDGSVQCYGAPQPQLRLDRRVHIVPTDPAEVVAELRKKANACAPSGGVSTVAVDSNGHVVSLSVATVARILNDAADLVAKKLGVE